MPIVRLLSQQRGTVGRGDVVLEIGGMLVADGSLRGEIIRRRTHYSLRDEIIRRRTHYIVLRSMREGVKV